MFAEFIKIYLVWTFLTIIFFSPILFYFAIKYLCYHGFYSYDDNIKYREIIKNNSSAEKKNIENAFFVRWFEKQKAKEKLVNDIYSFFDLDKVWKFLLFVVDILVVMFFAIGMLILPYMYNNSKKTIENNHRVVIEYEANLKPTKIICDKAEEYNEDLKDLEFTNSVEDQKEYIDTELLWARFLNNTNARAESIIKE